MAAYWRDNDDPAMPWHGPFRLPLAVPAVDAVSLVQSHYGDPGNLELVVRCGTRLYHVSRDSGPAFAWSAPTRIGDSRFCGNPVIITSRYGQRGDFFVVCPLVAGGLVIYRRHNDDGGSWRVPGQLVGSTGREWDRVYFGQTGDPARLFVDAVGFIQSTYGEPGNFEVIARCDDRLVHFWRDCGPTPSWHGPFTIY